MGICTSYRWPFLILALQSSELPRHHLSACYGGACNRRTILPKSLLVKWTSSKGLLPPLIGTGEAMRSPGHGQRNYKVTATHVRRKQ